MCVPTLVTTIQTAEREVEEARLVLSAADGVDWVSDAADGFRAMLAEVVATTVGLTAGLQRAFPAVDAAHAAVAEATRRTTAGLTTPGPAFGPGVGAGFAALTVSPW